MTSNNISNAPKKRPRLLLEIAVVLCCKLAAIFALWYFFFGPETRIAQTPDNVAAGILDRGPEISSNQMNHQGADR